MGSQASEAGFHFYLDYQKCKRFWFNKYVRKLEKNDKAPALIFGEAGHAAMEQYYNDIMAKVPFHERPARAKEVFVNQLQEAQERYRYHDRFEDDIQRALNIMDLYPLHYAGDTLMPIVVEQLHDVELNNGQHFTGRIDLVVTNAQGQRYIMDHKFTGWSLNSFSKSVQASDQATAYLYLWNTSHPDEPASGVIFNIIREYKGNVNFLRPIVTKTRNDIREFELDLMDEQEDIMRRLNNPQARWPKNTGACFMFNRPCEYIEICAGENFQPMEDIKFHVNDSTS